MFNKFSIHLLINNFLIDEKYRHIISLNFLYKFFFNVLENTAL